MRCLWTQQNHESNSTKTRIFGDVDPLETVFLGDVIATIPSLSQLIKWVFTCIKNIKVFTEFSSCSKTSKHEDLIPAQSKILRLQGRRRWSTGFNWSPDERHWNRAESQNPDLSLKSGSSSYFQHQCWRPWGCQLESGSVRLRTRRCCLPWRQSCTWESGGPRHQSLSTPRSETLLETQRSIFDLLTGWRIASSIP